MTTIPPSIATLRRLGWAATVRSEVAGHQQFQSQQDGLAEIGDKPAVDVGLAMGEPNEGDAERDHCSDDDDDDPCAVDGHPDLLDNVVGDTRSRPSTRLVGPPCTVCP